MLSIAIVICLKSLRITKIELGVSDGQPDGRTDKAAYRDARTHLKMEEKKKGKVAFGWREKVEKLNLVKCKRRAGR